MLLPRALSVGLARHEDATGAAQSSAGTYDESMQYRNSPAGFSPIPKRPAGQRSRCQRYAGPSSHSYCNADPLEPRVGAYGTWHSPISAGTVASGALRLSRVVLDGDNIYWIEGRPAEGGRSVIVKRDDAGQIVDATPAATNVRTRVHEYGGAAYVVSHGIIYYSEFADQRVYELKPGGAPEPVTAAGRLVLCRRLSGPVATPSRARARRSHDERPRGRHDARQRRARRGAGRGNRHRVRS